MICWNCGATIQAGAHACSRCGVKQPINPNHPPRTPTPTPPTPGRAAAQIRHMATPPAGKRATAAIQSRKNKGGRRGCCFWGCIASVVLLVLAAVLILVGLWLWTDVPERLGLKESPAERLLSGPPDRQAAAEIKDELQDAGIDTTGLSLFVLPILVQ